MTNFDPSSVVTKAQSLSESSAQEYLNKRLSKLKDNHINQLGLAFYRSIEYGWAVHCLRYLVEKTPQHYQAHNNLGLSLNRQGKGREAVIHYQKSLLIKPDYHPARANLAFTSMYFGETGRPEILEAHKDIASHVFNTSRNYLTSDELVDHTKRPLNIAYLSSDFRDHAVGRFMFGILEHHDRSKFSVTIIDNRPNNNDVFAKKFKALGARWLNISDTNTDDACKLISSHQIDILIDLAGHTSGGRPDIFANRVAPMQVTYLGYPNTSALPNMDFRIGDSYADPPSLSNQNTEQVLRLPHAMWNYTAWDNMPEPLSVCPFESNGYITFGSGNNHAKLQREWLEVWAEVLIGVPNSRLMLKSRALNSQAIRDNVHSLFKSKGINSDRIQMQHYSPTKASHWETLSQFDIGLDSYPYNGTTTTCDLLWLGVPIITQSGNSHSSRTTGSILSTLGLRSWVSSSRSEFIDLCIEKSHDHFQLKKLRTTLRKRLSASSLGAPNIFMVEYEKALVNAWALLTKPS